MCMQKKITPFISSLLIIATFSIVPVVVNSAHAFVIPTPAASQGTSLDNNHTNTSTASVTGNRFYLAGKRINSLFSSNSDDAAIETEKNHGPSFIRKQQIETEFGFSKNHHKWLWGGSIEDNLLLEKAGEVYMNNSVKIKMWLSSLWNNGITTTINLGGKWHKQNGTIAQDLIPGTSADIGVNEQNSRVDLLVGLNLMHDSHQMEVEGGVPVYYDEIDEQLTPDWLLTMKLKWIF